MGEKSRPWPALGHVAASNATWPCTRSSRQLVIATVLVALALGACAGAEPRPDPGECADVIDATITSSEGGYTVSATVQSADTGWDKYADAIVIRIPEGDTIGVRELTHPHVDEQPFTRSITLELPTGVGEIVVAANDSVDGLCGVTVLVEVPFVRGEDTNSDATK